MTDLMTTYSHLTGYAFLLSLCYAMIAYFMKLVTYGNIYVDHNNTTSFLVLYEALTQSLTTLARCLDATH